MTEFKLNEILQAVNGELIRGNSEITVTGLSVDSRSISRGDLFLAIKGERFDGHSFLNKAIETGATAVLVMQDVEVGGEIPIIKVKDSRVALGAIARYHREKFEVPLIGITGSNGKTTTKDLVAAALSGKMSIVKNEANYNNEIGLPLTLLRMDRQTEAVIVEMGMRGLGQIHYLAAIAKPNIGIITNIGQTHLELLGSEANIAKAKAELIEALPFNGVAILNGDDPWIRQMEVPNQVRTIWYGLEKSGLDYRAGAIETNEKGSSFKVFSANEQFDFFLPLPGRHNVLNALAAIVTGRVMGLSIEDIRKGLAAPVMTGRRLKILNQNQIQIIDDTYNASPASVKAALEVLCQAGNRGRKIAILADMLELGEASSDLHREVGQFAGRLGVDYLFAYGAFAVKYVDGISSITPGKGEYFSSKPDLIRMVKEFTRPGDSILVKGSRGMRMEEVVEALSSEEVAVHD